MEKDLEKARRVFEDNCTNFNNTESCRKTALYKLWGKGGDQEVTSALGVFKKACLQNDAPSCAALAELKTTDKRFEVPKDYREGLRYLEKACDLDDGASCHLLGTMYLIGNSDFKITKDFKKAFDYSLKACERFFVPACNNVSVMYRRGQGVEKDIKKANEYREKVEDYIAQSTRASASVDFEQGLSQPQKSKR